VTRDPRRGDGVGAAPRPGRVRVKICGVTRPEDAVACEAAGADAIGLIFAARSRRRVDAQRAAEVAAAAGPFLTRVGVFQDAPEEEILAAVEAARLDAVQLHGGEPDPLAERLRRRVRVVRALRFEPGVTPETLAGRPHDAVLLDGLKPGSGQAFDWAAAEAWRGHPRLVLAGGLRPDTVAEAVRALRPYAVDVASGVESGPGEKDPEAVAAFIEAARGA
jgi:phosphoribosylanthranilate isomerase